MSFNAATPSHPWRPRRQPRRAADPPPSELGAAETPGDSTAQLLYTPGEAAARLRVRESWLRRKAAARAIPCTFLGKHLRFSARDLAAIVAAAAQPPTGRRRRRNTRSAPRRADLTSTPKRSVDPTDPHDHYQPDGSTKTPWPG